MKFINLLLHPNDLYYYRQYFPTFDDDELLELQIEYKRRLKLLPYFLIILLFVIGGLFL